MITQKEIEQFLEDALEKGLIEDPAKAMLTIDLAEKVLTIFDENNVQPNMALHVMLLVTQTIMSMIEKKIDEDLWDSN